MALRESNIDYCCIGTAMLGNVIGFNITAEYPKSSSLRGKLPSIIQKLLENLSQREEMKIISDQQYKYFYSVQGSKIALCIANYDCRRRVAFGLLDNLLSAECTKSSDLKLALKRANDPTADKITQANIALEQVYTQVIENIDKVLERGNNLDQVLLTTSEVSTSAETFQKSSKALKRKMGMTLMFLILILLLIICFVVSTIVIIFVVLACVTIPSSSGCGLFHKKQVA